MFNAAREKSRLWLLILVGVVATLLGQTHTQQIFERLPPASDQIALPAPATTGDFYDADCYDASDCFLAANNAGGMIFQSGRVRGVELAGDLLESAKVHGARRGDLFC